MKKKLRVCIIDLITNAASKDSWRRVMFPNFAGIMPQVIAIWCEQQGHDVQLLTFTGFEDLAEEVPVDTDIVFISAFTQAALLAYALSNRLRSHGAVTVLGGPHARCYPEDACKYFDYVLGFTDKDLIKDVLQDCHQNRPVGEYLASLRNPGSLPGVRERWRFIEDVLKKALLLRMVPMIGSMGCPYTCSFCIDSTVPYQPLSTEIIQEDLRFFLTKFKKPLVSWYYPNFGVRFNEIMGAIEEAVPPGSIRFAAESSLSLLSEPHLKILKKNGFVAMLPGIESWYDMGNKSGTGRRAGMEKVQRVSDHVNTIMSYIPYVQTNFVIGLDCDEGPEPFELTKLFVDKCPGAFPGYSVLTAFGRSAPLYLDYQRTNRVLPFPFHFLNNNQAMNVKPKNYEWPEFYEHLIDLNAYTFSWSAIYKRFKSSRMNLPRWLNLMRAVSEGWGRLKYHKKVLHLLKNDRKFRAYFEGETTELHPFYIDIIKKDLGPLWKWLPKEALHHDTNAYLKSVEA
ncbi:MAG: radical SAM protein [Bacteroidota bacterium]